MAEHARFSIASGVPVYFCDPRSPWQRGSNENANGLLRQYFPRRRTDFRALSQNDLDHVAAELNGSHEGGTRTRRRRHDTTPDTASTCTSSRPAPLPTTTAA